MEIRFQTKEESNRLQREDFLKLSVVDVFLPFSGFVQPLNIFLQKKAETKE